MMLSGHFLLLMLPAHLLLMMQRTHLLLVMLSGHLLNDAEHSFAADDSSPAAHQSRFRVGPLLLWAPAWFPPIPVPWP